MCSRTVVTQWFVVLRVVVYNQVKDCLRDLKRNSAVPLRLAACGGGMYYECPPVSSPQALGTEQKALHHVWVEVTPSTPHVRSLLHPPPLTSGHRRPAATLLSPGQFPDIRPWFSATVKHRTEINLIYLLINNSYQGSSPCRLVMDICTK